MRKIIYSMSVSLDGYIEAADGDLSWSVPDEELHQHFNDREADNDLHLYGRRMYELMAAFWPTADENPAEPPVVHEYARIWRAKRKVVFSTTLKQVEWNSTLAGEDIGAEIRRLRAQPGKAMSVGGALLASSLARLGLIDEYWLYVHPVVLGSGKPYFGKGREKMDLTLVETHTFGSQVVLLRYQRGQAPSLTTLPADAQ